MISPIRLSITNRIIVRGYITEKATYLQEKIDSSQHHSFEFL